MGGTDGYYVVFADKYSGTFEPATTDTPAESLTIKEMLNTTQTDDDIAAERHSAPTTPQED